MKITSFGDLGAWIEVEPMSPSTSARAARQLAERVRRWLRTRGIAHPEIIAGGTSVLALGVEASMLESDRDAFERAPHVDQRPEGLDGQLHTVEVVYDGEDLDEVAGRSGLSRQEVIQRHNAVEYTVEVLGFLPGFGYLAENDPALRIPRRASPRKLVPAGSVAIAGRFSGIYPFGSPGGWNLLGRAVEPRLFDLARDPPSRFRAGDRVRFVPTDARIPKKAAESALPSRTGRAIEIRRCPPHTSVQDLGRRLRGEGIPSGGALDRDALIAANAAVGNPDDAAALEIVGGRAELIALRSLSISIDGAPTLEVGAGDSIQVDEADRLGRYLAVRGGIEVPLVLGSRSTLALARFGGLDGRRLMKGDRLDVGMDAGDPGRGTSVSAPRLDPPRAIRVFEGPRLDRFEEGVFERLLTEELIVSPQMDRVGTRLRCRPIERNGADAASPEPVARGAVQVTSDGTPIVLGPDAAVTGGYPIIGVIAADDLPAFSRLRPGGSFRFVRGA